MKILKNFVLTLAEGATHVNLLPIKARFGFTLAEVLITLGIIGVVAAMTIPTLMSTFAKQRTETQLKAFYSRINQTIKMSIADNGDPDGWIEEKAYSYDEQVEFLKQYIFPYMKNLGYEECTHERGQIHVCIYLMDGSGMTFSVDRNGGDIAYYINQKDLIEEYKGNGVRVNVPRKIFAFNFAKATGKDLGDGKIDSTRTSTDFVTPYAFNWDGTEEGLTKNGTWACVKGCTNCGYCTKMIQLNGWKIPKNYPW